MIRREEYGGSVKLEKLCILSLKLLGSTEHGTPNGDPRLLSEDKRAKLHAMWKEITVLMNRMNYDGW